MYNSEFSGVTFACALCGERFNSEVFHLYCSSCSKKKPPTKDDVLDAHDTLAAITLMATLMRIVGVQRDA
jgi:hypothetical protein